VIPITKAESAERVTSNEKLRNESCDRLIARYGSKKRIWFALSRATSMTIKIATDVPK